MLNINKKIKKIIKFNTHSVRKIAPQRYFAAGSQKLPVQFTNPLKNFNLKKLGGKTDWDGDGIKNWKDCRPRNVMRQDMVTLFHGTKKQNIPIIQKQGLKPTKNVFGPPAVFLTAQKNRAIYHARKGSMSDEGAVLKVKVDDKHLGGESFSQFKKHPFKEVKIYNTIPPNKISLMRGVSLKKQQEWNMMSLSGKKAQQSLRFDTDGDGVPNKYDCQPNNKWKQDNETKREQFSLKSGVPIVDYPESFGHTGKRVFMSPDEFMDKVKKGYDIPEHREWSRKEHEERVIFTNALDKLKKVIADPNIDVDAPYLEYTKSGGIDHEGRHRAVAAKRLGMKEIPVNIVYSKDETKREQMGRRRPVYSYTDKEKLSFPFEPGRIRVVPEKEDGSFYGMLKRKKKEKEEREIYEHEQAMEVNRKINEMLARDEKETKREQMGFGISSYSNKVSGPTNVITAKERQVFTSIANNPFESAGEMDFEKGGLEHARLHIGSEGVIEYARNPDYEVGWHSHHGKGSILPSYTDIVEAKNSSEREGVIFKGKDALSMYEGSKFQSASEDDIQTLHNKMRTDVMTGMSDYNAYKKYKPMFEKLGLTIMWHKPNKDIPLRTTSI